MESRSDCIFDAFLEECISNILANVTQRTLIFFDFVTDRLFRFADEHEREAEKKDGGSGYRSILSISVKENRRYRALGW